MKSESKELEFAAALLLAMNPCNRAEAQTKAIKSTLIPDFQLLDLQVAGLQGFGNTLRPKS